MRLLPRAGRRRYAGVAANGDGMLLSRYHNACQEDVATHVQHAAEHTTIMIISTFPRAAVRAMMPRAALKARAVIAII